MEDWNSANNEDTPLVNPTTTIKHNGLFDPRGPYLKWIAVFFMCFLSFGKTINFYIKLNK
jgi:hypothetical protein